MTFSDDSATGSPVVTWCQNGVQVCLSGVYEAASRQSGLKGSRTGIVSSQVKDMIHLKRAYDPAGKRDGLRILVERLWPRGVAKEAAKIDLWLKDLAPSSELRKWFQHDPEKWGEFCRRYHQELKEKEDLLQLLKYRTEEGTVTFVYAAHDTEHNSALALKLYLEEKI